MSIAEIFRRLNKSTQVGIVAFATAIAVAVPTIAVKAGFGPNGDDRKIFDFSNPAEREGAFDAPRFNSYINTNVYGDERAFLDTKACVVNGPECYSEGQSGGYLDKAAAEIGKEYIVRAYVHNIANPSTNGANQDGVGVAKNTRIRFEIPEGVGTGFTMQARISADNSIPAMVYDTADLDSTSQAFDLEYVPGSAFISNAAHPNGVQLSDDIVGANGAQIGYDAMNGNFPGCFEFSAFVTIRVKAVAPNLEVQKLVSKAEVPKLAESSEQITAKRGETISWRVDYKNSGSATMNDVTLRDPLPAGLTLVPGSITLTDANHPTPFALPDSALGSGGTNMGDYLPNGNGAIRFRTKINEDFKECEIKNIAYGRAEGVSERSDDAKVVIEDCQPEQPVFSCDVLKQTEKITDRKFRLTASTTQAGGATFKQFHYDFGDGTPVLVTDKTVVEHEYPVDGKFVTTVRADFTVNGETQSASSDACKVVIATQKPPVTPPTTPPTTLVATGTGSLLGIFAATSFVGALLYRRRVLR